MADELLVPQVILDGKILKQAGNTKRVPWSLSSDTITYSVKKEVECLSLLNQKSGTIVVWQEIDSRFSQFEMYQIQQELEKLIHPFFPDEWEVEAVTPRAGINGTDPSDVSRIVHTISKRYPFEIVAQLPGIGHGKLYDLVFREGIRQSENRYAAVFFANGEAVVEKAEIVPLASDWLGEFQSFIMDHDYMAAYELLDELEDSVEKQAAASLLRLMIHRMNFDFEDARIALDEARSIAGETELFIETDVILKNLLSKDAAIRDLARIMELYRHLEMYLDLDDMVSFLIRFYRAREAILLYLIEHKQIEGLGFKKETYSSIYQLIEKIEEMYDKREINSHFGAYFYLKSLNVAKLLQGRNQSFIGHGRSGIDNDVAWQSYFGTSRTTLSRAKKRFLMDSNIMLREFGLEMDNNVEKINLALLQLSEKLTGKGAVSL
ncbi:hypothetical protein [Bacillus sp. EB01]|uniref:hypothetical protein n=1 Tax=Bacillus sp. EB01 TaxID=1347086 RepID=UPI0005C79C58|nr:hypothetical protein [Bacillus sp. EB01]